MKDKFYIAILTISFVVGCSVNTSNKLNKVKIEELKNIPSQDIIEKSKIQDALQFNQPHLIFYLLSDSETKSLIREYGRA